MNLNNHIIYYLIIKINRNVWNLIEEILLKKEEEIGKPSQETWWKVYLDNVWNRKILCSFE